MCARLKPAKLFGIAFAEPFDCTARCRKACSEAGLKQIAARRRFPIQHFPGDEGPRPRAKHEARVYFIEGNAASR